MHLNIDTLTKTISPCDQVCSKMNMLAISYSCGNLPKLQIVQEELDKLKEKPKSLQEKEANRWVLGNNYETHSRSDLHGDFRPYSTPGTDSDMVMSHCYFHWFSSRHAACHIAFFARIRCSKKQQYFFRLTIGWRGLLQFSVFLQDLVRRFATGKSVQVRLTAS